MKKRRPKSLPRRPNLAAKALGGKIFGLKVVTPAKGYSRKGKHLSPAEPEPAGDDES